MSLKGRKQLGKLLREARHAALSKAERTAIARTAANARWAQWRAKQILRIFGDGKHDDTAAIQARIDAGLPLDGRDPFFSGRTLKISRAIRINNKHQVPLTVESEADDKS